MDSEELYDLQADPNEWYNLTAHQEHAGRKAELQKIAPVTCAEPAVKLNTRKDLVLEGKTFQWERGKGNYKPPPKYLPYTQEPVDQTDLSRSALTPRSTP